MTEPRHDVNEVRVIELLIEEIAAVMSHLVIDAVAVEINPLVEGMEAVTARSQGGGEEASVEGLMAFMLTTTGADDAMIVIVVMTVVMTVIVGVVETVMKRE